MAVYSHPIYLKGTVMSRLLSTSGYRPSPQNFKRKKIVHILATLVYMPQLIDTQLPFETHWRFYTDPRCQDPLAGLSKSLHAANFGT